MPPIRFRRVAAPLLLAVLLGLPRASAARQVVLTPPMPDSVVVTYLANGGWLIESGGEALLTGVLASNPRGPRVLFGTIESDTAAVRSWLQEYDAQLARVRSIVVGHAHYDHLMDVPTVVRQFASRATVFGSSTARNTIVGWSGLADDQIRAIDASVGDHLTEGAWLPANPGRFRFQAIKSSHAPHALGGLVHLWKGTTDTVYTSRPRKARQWKEGPTYAYLIEVLDGAGEPFFQIYYQDSGAAPFDGYPAPTLDRSDGVPLLALLTAPGYDQVDDYPEGIIGRLRPDWVLAHHWDDFLFSDVSVDPRPTPFTAFGGFVRRMDAMPGQWWRAAVPKSRWVFKPE